MPPARTATTPVVLTLTADRLPGTRCGGYENVHVAVQRRARPAELLGLIPGDAPAAEWTLECTAILGPDGTPDVRGPYVQGPPGGRFVYLSWGTVGPDGGFAMFRRAKLMLAAVPAEVLADAVRSARLHGRLGLTGAGGGALCARVEPPLITWEAG